jgi:hypothetical protein
VADRKNRFLSGLRTVGDRLAWGPKGGDKSFTPFQLLGGIGSRALNFVLPGVGTAANIAGNAYYGAGPLGFIGRNMGQPGGVQPQPITGPGGGVSVPDYMPQVGMTPQMQQGGFMPSPYGPYASGYQFPMQPAPDINPISGLPNTQTGYGVSLPNYGQTTPQRQVSPTGFLTGHGSGGPYKSTFMNDAWGDTAAGFGIGIGAPGQTQSLGLSDVLSRARSA